MLFTIDKNKSLALLQAVMAFFLVLAPSALELLPIHSAVYALFIVFTLIFTVRIKKTQKVYFSPIHLVLLPFMVYVIISSLWAKNNEGHLLACIFSKCLMCPRGILCREKSQANPFH